MHFPISGIDLNPFELIGLGFGVGVMGGFFGVGGSFIAGPALAAMGMPMNYVVGTDLCHIVGKSVVAARKHRMLGNVDVKLGLLMTVGTIVGVELGAQAIEWLKRLGDVDMAVSVAFLVLLTAIAACMLAEVYMTVRRGQKGDRHSFQRLAEWVQRRRWGPRIELPVSGVRSISVGAILLVSLVGGLCSGFLGGGAGYVRMPMLVYVLGIPTHVAVGTDLFEIIVSASYGTISHALKGNVDVMVALVMHTGAALGAQIGAGLLQRFGGTWVRLAFAPMPLLGAGLILYRLFFGGGHP